MSDLRRASNDFLTCGDAQLVADETAKLLDHTPRSVVRDPAERIGYGNATLIKSDVHDYYRGAHDLHLHGTAGDVVEFCAVIEAVGVAHVAGDPDALAVIARDDGAVRVHQSRSDYWKLGVSVCIAESIEDCEPRGRLVVVPSKIRRLVRLDDCDRSFVHRLGGRLPAGA